MNKLRGPTLIATEKVTGYLLNPFHEEGGGEKAAFFTRFGFARGASQLFVDALQQHAREHDIQHAIEGEYGRKFIIKCKLRTPDGRDPCVVVIWIRETGTDHDRLVTAYPA